VCSGTTAHAEACRIQFDPAKVSYAELIEFFFRTHDPTQLNGALPKCAVILVPRALG
jgi:peptide-methionine (S)-S-oxide reductase